MRAAGAAIVTLGWTRTFDLRPPWQLRRLVRHFRPDVVHAWGISSLRAVTLAQGRTAARVVVSKPLLPQGQPGPLDRALLSRADLVTATGVGEAELCRQLGLGVRVVIVPPSVEEGRPWAAEDQAPPMTLAAPFVLCAGPLEPHKGFRDAIWGFDILRFLFPDLNLLLLGNGSDRPRLERFVRRVGAGHYVHFAGDRADVPSLLERADLVWVPSLAEGGITFALEAMAAGRPVIASRLPGLAEVIRDGETGFLVPPGDKVIMARQTRLLLSDAARRQAMGEAGKRRIRDGFSTADLVRRYTALYDSCAA
jgi:glycosyltransferase involved in cell wall biosynthesis